MKALGILDITLEAYDSYLRTDGEKRTDRRRRVEIANDQALGVNPAQARALGIRAHGFEANASGVAAHTLNPNPRLRA